MSSSRLAGLLHFVARFLRSPRGRTGVILAVILLSAAAVRLAGIGSAPPGLHQDEGINAFTAYCIARTGRDMTGDALPLRYSRAINDNRSTLYYYLHAPFLAIGGLSVATVRIPPAVFGVITVFIIYLVGARLFGTVVGLVAAGLLTLNPWHVHLSRFGFEAMLCPLLVLLTVGMFWWARLPIRKGTGRSPRPVLAGLAGVVAGVCCYGYQAVRLFLPAFILVLILTTWRGWWRILKTKRGVTAVCALVIGGAVTFGPLAWTHLTDEAGTGINARGSTTWVWDKDDPILTKARKVLARYPGHFGPDFLFINGDHFAFLSPSNTGQFHWYMLPLWLLGLAWAVWHARRSLPARILLVWVVMYPFGDLSSTHDSMHALRSSPGLGGMILLAAAGAVWAGRWLLNRQRIVAIVAGAVMGLAVVGLNVRYLYDYFGPYNRRPEIYHAFHTDLLEACEWLRPRMGHYEAVFFTVREMNQPFATTLVAFGTDPKDWFDQPRAIHKWKEWDLYVRHGKCFFLYLNLCDSVVQQLRTNGRKDLVAFVVRPGEYNFQNPSYVVRGPDGKDALWVCEKYLPEDSFGTMRR
jgi:4-amino-4-deoxy-L-arabinose transferase-like glycosyltransferase